jgi:hypothetical protein
MKPGFLLFVCLLTLSSCLVAQTSIYKPFPKHNASWREMSGGYQSSDCKDYQYIIRGDTLIDSLAYHILHLSGVKYYETMYGEDCSWDIMSYLNEDFAMFRNDSAQRKVYARDMTGGPERMLYDFDLDMGDTLPSSMHTFWGDIVTVCSVDSILIGNKYHRRLGMASNYWGEPDSNYVHIIEGIGSTSGLFGFLSPPFEFGSYLLCFIYNGITVYPDTTIQCILVGNQEKDKPQFSIYPNPLTQHGRISLDRWYDSVRLRMFALDGREISSYEYWHTNELQIDRAQLVAGIYILSLALDGKTASPLKLVVGE